MHSSLFAIGAFLGAAVAKPTTYACNPAHSYPNGASCVSTNGCLSLVTPTTSASATASASRNCDAEYDSCRSLNDANNPPDFVPCAALYAECLGPEPFTRGSMTATGMTSKITKSTKMYYTTKYVTAFTTYCPSPTTLSINNSTMEITSTGHVTVPCPTGCVVTRPMSTQPVNATTSKPTVAPSSSVPVYQTNSTSMYTTKHVTQVTTYCPSTGVITYGANQTTSIKTPGTYTMPVTQATPTTAYTTQRVTQVTTYCPSTGVITYGGNQTTSIRTPGTYTMPVTQTISTTTYTTKPVTQLTTYCPSTGVITYGANQTTSIKTPGTYTMPITQTIVTASIVTQPMSTGANMPSSTGFYTTFVVPPTTMTLSSPTTVSYGGNTYTATGPTTIMMPGTTYTYGMPTYSASTGGYKPTASMPAHYEGAAPTVKIGAGAVLIGVAGLLLA
ncbi:hypothetical protein KC343_g8265 [Hortaea werneckii]|uniref:Ig-like domain-containing protein n=1 Tax=Hortaea werneckii TaxID=91943 RepID=A0A3M7HLC1_HORWE|nr:hypothetical protein KC352_g24508 [Hortaea werneckii]KAI7570020.1 hypothetical protein KC317_g2829 [Hortaea werneckii]KAI7607831.1 hypothetical protein KC346_g9907 [Hortaea werneckii]KAI7620773.1 hypothetical protein KC343_g8265 [Hortaea werneckii]KAI7661447.1 hypothetical protein KC319_g8400 [Hortaea werneckii]